MTLVRLHCIVEGQTEEAFVRDVLAPHLASSNVFADARSVFTSRRGARWHRGGMTSFDRARYDILAWMKQDRHTDARFTTMFDLYRLPQDFPGAREVPPGDPRTLVAAREDLLARAIRAELDDPRFLPYLQLHEFEALLLAAPAEFKATFPERHHERAIAEIEALVSRCGSPEEIDLDQPPSKRILACLPGYEKGAAAAAIARRVGIARMTARCPHFAEWIGRLERLAEGG